MCLVAGTASAQSPTAGADIDVVSRYIWRAVPYSNGAAVQPSVWKSVDALTVSLWSNLVMADRIDRGQFNHVFVSATYRADAGRFTIEPSVQWYHTRAFGSVAASTSTEGVVRISTGVSAFRFFTNHSVDVQAYDGAYFGDAGLVHLQKVGPRTEVSTQFAISWATARFNDAFFGVAKGAVNHASLSAQAAIRLDDHWSLRPHAEVQPIIDAALRRASPSNLFVTAGVGVSFAY